MQLKRDKYDTDLDTSKNQIRISRADIERANFEKILPGFSPGALPIPPYLN
jgi:hypothetical protein